MNSGFYSLLHPNCHCQIIRTKFNLKIFYPLHNERVFWHYQDANLSNNPTIQQSISHVSWEKVFSNNGVNKQVSIFNETIHNITTNFIPHKTQIFNNWEPPWINNKVKRMIQEIKK